MVVASSINQNEFHQNNGNMQKFNIVHCEYTLCLIFFINILYQQVTVTAEYENRVKQICRFHISHGDSVYATAAQQRKHCPGETQHILY